MPSIILPARNEADLDNTISSYLAAGAREIIVIDDCSDELVQHADKRVKIYHNSEPMGPAYCRNLGATFATGDVIVYSDAHVRFDGDLLAFSRQAKARRCVLCAACASLDSGEIVGYGAHWFYDSGQGVYRVAWSRQEPPARYSQITALCGSVYAMAKETYKKIGGWPATISHGYNEAALSLACLFTGVDMVVDAGTVQRHKFRPAAPYEIQAFAQRANIGIAHRIMFSESFFQSFWWPRLCLAQPTAAAYLRAHAEELDRANLAYALLKRKTDAEVMAVLERDVCAARPKVAGIMALAPQMFCLWRRCLSALAAQCDQLYLRVDMHHIGQTTLEEIRLAAGEKLCGLFASYEPWTRWNWREDLLRMLDRAGVDIVLCPDQDEEFSDCFADELREFCQSDKNAMMFDYCCPTDDGAQIEKHPRLPHMKAFKWRPGLTYKNYQGFARVTEYATRGHWQARCKINHLCFFTPELRAAKVLH